MWIDFFSLPFLIISLYIYILYFSKHFYQDLMVKDEKDEGREKSCSGFFFSSLFSVIREWKKWEKRESGIFSHEKCYQFDCWLLLESIFRFKRHFCLVEEVYLNIKSNPLTFTSREKKSKKKKNKNMCTYVFTKEKKYFRRYFRDFKLFDIPVLGREKKKTRTIILVECIFYHIL